MSVFDCRDCGAETSMLGEYYMVTDEVWQQSGLTHNGDMLCIGSLEAHLGRRLRAADFTWCPLNFEKALLGSERLRDRLDAKGFLLHLRWRRHIRQLTIAD
jgi:hypothetical protein